MNTRHSPFGVPRKTFVSRLYKSLSALLALIALAFSGLYAVTNLNIQQQTYQQESLHEFLDTVLSLQSFSTQDSDDLTMPPFEPAEQSASQVDILNSEWMQMKVAFDYERQILAKELIWYYFALFVLVVIVAVVLIIRAVKQAESGFTALHHVIDHHKQRRAANYQPRSMSDEFTDIMHLVDNELASRDFDLSQHEHKKAVIDSALSHLDAVFFITNDQGDIAWISAGAQHLWHKDTAVFESMFGIDAGLDDPIGEKVADSILFLEQTLKFPLSDGLYILSVCSLMVEESTNGTGLQRLIILEPKSDDVEFDILHHSLMLLEKDVWNMPIRVARPDSPYSGFAKSLESVRHKVLTLFDTANASLAEPLQSKKIAKLQQLNAYIEESAAQSNPVSSHSLVEEASFKAEISSELADIAVFSEQVRDSLILGFELVLQRLCLVEKDLSSDVFLLREVDRCLNEVRAGVLTSLSATEGEGENIRRRFAVDLEHDISKVQEQVEGMKSVAATTLALLESDRSVGLARLGRANEAVTQMLARVAHLREKVAIESVAVTDDLDSTS